MNKKIIVSTLALAMGAALAGSVSGTVAWFQYATRAQVSYIGTSGHCSELLQISVDDGSTWKNEFETSDLTGNNVTADGSDIVPITSGGVAKDANVSSFYSNPIYQISGASYADTWNEALTSNYLQFTIKFRVADVNENGKTDYLDKDIYLLDLTLQDADGSGDLSEALRVHFHTSAGVNFLIAKTATSTATSGNLDLNGDNSPDLAEGYEWDTGRSAITYGSGTQTSYAVDELLASDDGTGNLSGGESLGNTGGGASFSITVTIWLEGWHQYNSSAIWDSEDYVGKGFQVGMRFAVPLHDNANE